MKKGEKMKRVRKIIAILLTVLTLMSVISAATPVLAVEVTEIIESESTDESYESTEAESTEESSETDEMLSAEELSEENEVNESDIVKASSETEEAEILYEDTSRRDEFTKHFVMRNGLNKAVKYAQPIHYKENEEWVDIDNTLEYNQETEKYENKANSFKVNFDNKLNSEELFSIENRGYTMSWKYNSSTKRNGSAGKVEKHSNKKEKSEKYKPKPNGKIKYDKFETDTNLEYIVTGTGVKENIILESYNGKNSFSFEVKAKALDFVKNEDRSISVVNQSGEEIFYIPAPFMFDADNNYSYDVDYTIESKKNKSIITIIADSDWLEDNGRKYPVTIDPAIETDKTKAAIETTFVASGNPNTNYDDMRDVYIGVESTNYEKCRALVKFDLPELNAGDMVIGATLGLCLHSTSFYVLTMPDKQINAHIIKTTWSAGSVTWSTQPQINENVVTDYNFIKKSDESGYVYKKFFDVTRAVKEWYEGTSSNYGIMIKADVEDGSDADVAARGIFWSDKYNDNSDWYPYIEIAYRNNKGLESYWSYSSFGVGVAGTAHINDYTGNLVYELPLASSISEIMPVSIVGYYNNYCAKKLVSDTQAKNVRTSIGRGFRLNYQQTVLPSSKYGLSETEAETYPYVYTDGDGTEHYIQKITEKEKNKDGEEVEKTIYKDEDGLGLTLTTGLNDNNEVYYKITDKAHNTYYFNLRGNLSRIKDKNGNQIQVIYKEGDSANNLLDRTRIDKIIDGAGHTFTFTYNTNKKLDYVRTIVDDAGRVIDFDISEGLLTDVEYPNKDTVFISYNISDASGDSEGRINAITSNGNYCLNIDYTSKKTGRRVSAVKEYGLTYNSDNSKNYHLGQEITFDRTKYNTTVIRTPGKNGEHYIRDKAGTVGDDDIITTLQFDDFGKTVSQQVSLGDGTQSVAGTYNYTSESSSLASKNKISSAAGLGKNVVNYVKNISAENSGGWSFSKTSSTTESSGFSENESYIGARSIKLKCTSFDNAGDGVWAYQDISGLVSGRTYILSAYVKVTEIASSRQHTNKGASIAVKPQNSSNTTAIYSEKITEVSESGIDDGWRRISLVFDVPDNTNEMRIYMQLRSVVGTAYFDCISLEVGNTANPCNLLENSSFEKKDDSAYTPAVWNELGLTSSDYVTETKHINGSHSLKITGEATEAKRVYQKIPVCGDVNDTYIVSGWAMANAVNQTFHYTVDDKNTEDKEDDEIVYNSFFEIHIKVFYDNGKGGTYEEEKPAAKFNTTVDGWQYTAQAFSLKSTEHPEYDPIEIRIMPRYNNQENVAYFDHIQLIKDVAQSYTYDKEGNVISVSANAEQEINTKYDDNNNLTSHKDVLGNETTLNYDSKNNLTVTKSPKGVYAESFYNSKGNVTAQETRSSANTNTGRIIRTENEYNSATNGINANAYLVSTSDEHGYKTTYTYDWKTGKPKTVTDAMNHKTTYSYKDVECTTLEKVSAGEAFVKYTYDKDRLTDILFESNGGGNSELYSFTYDNFGNVEKTKVWGKTLSTNTYGNRNGQLKKTSYENKDAIENVYDEFGNLKKVIPTYNDTTASEPIYTWAYNSAGVTTIHRDYENGKRYFYYYDSIGRLIHQEIRTNDSQNHTHLGAIKYDYDLRNNLKSVTMDLGGKDLPVQKYGYAQTKDKNGNVISGSAEDGKDNLPTRYKLTTERYVDYEHDTLNRLNKKTLSTGSKTSGAPFVTSYTYKSSARNTGDSNLYRTTQLSTETIGGTEYSYNYSKIGNITSVKKNGSAYRSYEYDSTSQLIRENNQSFAFSKYWNYDSIGNIESVKTYEYTTDETFENVNQTEGIDYQYSTDSSTGWDRLLKKVVFKTYTYDADGNKTTETETKEIDYDAIGNPVKYLDHNMSWFGRQLQTINVGANTTDTTADDKTLTFTYGADGLRGTKAVKTGSTTVKSEYTYVNGLLAYEKRGNSELFFFYDTYSHLTAIRYYADASEDDYKQYYAISNSMGDVIGFVDGNGNVVASYEYDAWGNCEITQDTTSVKIADLNPIRYRGYYWDSETGFYYLQSRYYDPAIGRFLNIDDPVVLKESPMVLTDKNLFAYCDNNPVTRTDDDGEFWETAFDLVSLGISIVDVAKNPSDPLVWVSVVADTVDLIPFVTGVGEIVKSIRVAKKAAEIVDTNVDAIKAAKAIYNTADKASDIRKATGSYEIIYKSGQTYVGKGGFKRAINSAQRNATKYSDEVASITWKKAPDPRSAFIDEYKSMCKFGGPNNSSIKNANSYNQMWSPGRKYYYNDFGKFFMFGGKLW